MSFIQYITDKFENFHLIDAVELISLIAVLMFIYCYAAHHHGKFFSIVCIMLSIYVFLITMFGNEHFAVGTLAIVLAIQVISFIVFFRNELRRDIFKIGLNKHMDLFERDHSKEILTQEEIEDSIAQVVKACQNMSKSEVGALIVVAEGDIYDYIIESGTIINAEITSDLLETIFFPKSPLHDGAVIIKGNKIIAAGCYLPLSQDTALPKEFGTRHRAAYGLTESHPTSTSIVVSEESGIITAMRDKKFKRYMNASSLTQAIKIGYDLTSNSEKEAFWGGVEENAK